MSSVDEAKSEHRREKQPSQMKRANRGHVDCYLLGQNRNLIYVPITSFRITTSLKKPVIKISPVFSPPYILWVDGTTRR